MSERLAACYADARQASKVRHTLEELFRQRMFAIGCGYADANDAARLSSDPVMKLLRGGDAVVSDELASQPTLWRFENGIRRADLLRMGEALAQSVIKRHRRRKRKAKRITLDFDPTDDPTHGGQQQSLFNSFYDTWCYLYRPDLLPRFAHALQGRPEDRVRSKTAASCRQLIDKGFARLFLGQHTFRHEPRPCHDAENEQKIGL